MRIEVSALAGAQEAAEAAARAKQEEQAKLERQERPAAEPSVHAEEPSTAGPSKLSRASSSDESLGQPAPIPNGISQVLKAALSWILFLNICAANTATYNIQTVSHGAHVAVLFLCVTAAKGQLVGPQLIPGCAPPQNVRWNVQHVIESFVSLQVHDQEDGHSTSTAGDAIASSSTDTSDNEEPARPSPGPSPIDRQASSGPIRGHVEYLQVRLHTFLHHPACIYS